MQDLSEDKLQENYELYQKIQNTTRKEILTYIYEKPRNYSDLSEHTGLKPGSLYHHINVLDPLVEKREHGLYGITTIGKQIVEDLGLVKHRKPKITKDSSPTVESTAELETNENGPASPQIEGKMNDTKPYTTEFMESILWLGSTNYIILAIIAVVSLLLGSLGIAFAGSAIYSLGSSIAFLYDIIALILGWGVLYIIESIIFKNQVYNKLLYTFVIRILSMLPAAVVGLSLLLLYLSGILPSEMAFNVIFAITVLVGYIITRNGLIYLRGYGSDRATNVATILIAIDLLLGLIVLLST